MRALITGILGQDGSYLAEQLVAAGHEVFGLTRRPNAKSPATLVVGDLLDQPSLERALYEVEPDVVFNLAAVLDPGGGWAPTAPLMVEVTGVGVVRLLDAMTVTVPHAKLIHASSSAVFEPERYGLYGAAKRLAHDAVVDYRRRGKAASNAILFSHTSPRQDPRFLARRICTAIARGETLTLTDLNPSRDWGHAADYCQALRVMAESEPSDYIVSTGEQHTVRELVQVALNAAGRDWDAVRVVPGATYPDEVSTAGLPAKHVADLGWSPRTSFEAMVRELVEVAR